MKKQEKQLNFPRRRRLATKAEYQSIFDLSVKVNQKFCLGLYKPNQKSFAKLGIIVGKRVASDAVIRNQIKRIIRESFRANQEKVAGLNIIVIARQQCSSLTKVKLREDIDKLWEKLASQCRNARASS